MKTKNMPRWEKFMCSWWFFLILVLSTGLLIPVATNNFSFEAIGEIITHTLGNAWINRISFLSPVFQILALVFFALILFGKGRFDKWFTTYAGSSYLFFAVIQNVSITETYGVSIVTSNVVLMGLVAFVWLRDLSRGHNRYSFKRLNGKNAWLVAVSVFCFWWPLNPVTIQPDFNPVYLFTSTSAMAFCPMTPIFLAVLILSEPGIDPLCYRVTAMAGTIIGLLNMGSFANPFTFWLGVYHLPLLVVSIYALIRSSRFCKQTGTENYV